MPTCPQSCKKNIFKNINNFWITSVVYVKWIIRYCLHGRVWHGQSICFRRTIWSGLARVRSIRAVTSRWSARMHDRQGHTSYRKSCCVTWAWALTVRLCWPQSHRTWSIEPITAIGRATTTWTCQTDLCSSGCSMPLTCDETATISTLQTSSFKGIYQIPFTDQSYKQYNNNNNTDNTW